MTELIGDLLDAGSIDAGTLSVDAEPTDADALIDAARGAFLAGGTGHDVTVDLPADLPRVMADRARVVQVLGNLLANATRHAPPSPIRMAAALDGSITVSSSGIVDALRNEDRLVAIQRAIEATEGTAAPTARRGSRKAVKAVGRRKRTMTEEQRRAVAERMRKYWAARRAEKAEGN